MFAIFFDLDGTLCDSVSGVAHTIREIVSAQSVELSTEQVRSVIGPPISEMLRKLLPGIDDQAVLTLEAAFRKAYDEGNWRMFEWFPGVKQTVQRLHQQGCRLFIFTNKPEKAAQRIIDSERLGSYFEAVLGKDSIDQGYRSKTEMLRDLLMRYRVDISRAMVVGDGEEDLQAAQSLGLPFVFASYGYGSALETSGAHFEQIAHFQELIEICNRGLQ
jgi:phosphoglycolate phosphatase